jgi:hypothetical protein
MPKLTLETYARLLANAACRRGAPLGGLLAELGVDAADLQVADASLREEIAALWDKRQGIAAMKFAAAFGAELRRLGPIAGDGAVPTPPEAVAILAAAAPEVRETDMPSYLQAPSPAARGGLVAPPFLAPPVGPAPSEPVAAVATPALVHPEAKAPSHLAGTANLNLEVIKAAAHQGALPFGNPKPSVAGAVPAAEPGAAPEKRVPPVGSGTVGADFSEIVASAKRGGLPFSRPEPPRAEPTGTADEPDLSQLPLETFAAVSGALARGEARDAALGRHGLTSAGFDILAKGWAQRFQREPQLLERFKDLARNSATMGRSGDSRG